jgi:hypothetical protein
MPRILETDAFALARGIDTMDEAQRPQALDILARYKRQQEDNGDPEWPSQAQAEQESKSRLRGFFEDLKTVDAAAPSLASVLPYSQNPDEDRARVANTAYLASRYGKTPDEIGASYELWRDDYATRFLQSPAGLGDLAFHSAAAKEIQREKQKEETSIEGVKAALRGDDVIPALQAWQAKNLDRMPDSTEFTRGFLQARERAGNQLEFADALLKQIENNVGLAKGDGAQRSAPASRETAAQFEESLATLATMKPKDRKQVYAIIGAKAEAAGYDPKGFWSQMLSELGKGMARMGSTLQTQVGVTADVLQNFPAMLTNTMGEEAFAATDENIARRQGIGEMYDEVAGIVAGDVDPVRPVISWLNDTVETGLIKGPGAAAPFMLASAALGPYGAGALFTADFAEQNRRDLRAQGMDNVQAMSIGAAAAPLQAAAESLSNALQLGRFPAVQRALASFTKPIGGGAGAVARYVQNSTLALATEFTEEQVQDNLIVPATQEIFGALSEDVPDVDWSMYRNRAIESTPELLSILVPMALVFGGTMTAAQANLSGALVSSQDMLEAAGYSAAQANEIRIQSTPEAQVSKAREFWGARAGTPQTIEAAAQTVGERMRLLRNDTAAAQADLERRGILPRMLHAAEDRWKLTFNDGSTADFNSHLEADAARWQWATDQLGKVHLATRSALAQLESGAAVGREFAVEFKPDALTAEQAMSEGRVDMAQLERRVAQGEAVGETAAEPVNEADAFDAATLTDKATSDYLSSLQILGSSVNQFKDGVLRTTIRLYEGSNVLTLVEEKLEGDAKQIVESRPGREWLLKSLREYERVSGDKLFRAVADDSELQNDDLIEAWSSLGQSYLVGKSKKGAAIGKGGARRIFADVLKAGMAGAMNSETQFFNAVWRRAAKLSKLNREGKLGADLTEELERQLGIDSQDKFENEAAAEAEAIANEALNVGGASYSEESPGPNGETFSMSRAVPADASRQTIMPDGARLVGPTTFSIRAYHGTPHKVSKFSTAKIGTGEGAQAYGWGLYFAQSFNVADDYRGKLQKEFRIGFNGKTLVELYPGNEEAVNLQNRLETVAGNTQYGSQGDSVRKAFLGATYGDLMSKAPPTPSVLFARQVEKDYGNFIKTETGGNLYTVELLPDEADFLDWDKPLSEQSEKIRDAASELMAVLATTTREKLLALEEKQRGEAVRLGFNRSPIDMDKAIEMQLEEANASGAGLYKLVKGVQGKATPDEASEAASQYLASLGIPGIKYLDGGSRGAGEGTSNYVIFDENLVRILEENGKPISGETFSLRVTPAQDAEYMAAVEAGDMETAQRMVDAVRMMVPQESGMQGSRGEAQEPSPGGLTEAAAFFDRWAKDEAFRAVFGNQKDEWIKYLTKLAKAKGWNYGFAIDQEQVQRSPFYAVVLYIESPAGQLSFHLNSRNFENVTPLGRYEFPEERDVRYADELRRYAGKRGFSADPSLRYVLPENTYILPDGSWWKPNRQGDTFEKPYTGNWDGQRGQTAIRLQQLANDEAAKVSQGGFQKQESSEASAVGGTWPQNGESSPLQVNPNLTPSRAPADSAGLSPDSPASLFQYENRADDTLDAAERDALRAVRKDYPDATAANVLDLAGQPGLRSDRRRGAQASLQTWSNAFAAVFGKRVLFVNAPATFNGGNPTANRNILVVNVNSQEPLAYSVGHELWHAMRAQNPTLAKALETQILASGQNLDSYRQRLRALNYPESEIEQEIMADFLGSQMLEPEFLNRLAAEKPSLFARFAQSLLDFTRQLINRLSKLNRDVRPFFQERIEDLRDQLATALKTYAREGRFADNPLEGSGMQPSYAGEQALANLPAERQQFMRDSLETAKAMAAAGKTSEDIRAVTGWFPGKYDGKMRWEVPDEDARYLPAVKGAKFGVLWNRRLDEVLDHPKLFAAYPYLRNVRVQTVSGLGVNGSIQGDVISLNAENWDMERFSTLLHEVQHWIQKREGFAVGSNPQAENERFGFLRSRLNYLESTDEYKAGLRLIDRAWNAFDEASFSGDQGEAATAAYNAAEGAVEQIYRDNSSLSEARKVTRQLQKLTYGQLQFSAKNAYSRSAGEIEARDVQARQSFTPEQRKAIAPYSSENIDRDAAIIMGQFGIETFSLSVQARGGVPFKAGDRIASLNFEATVYSVESRHSASGYWVVYTDVTRGPLWKEGGREPLSPFAKPFDAYSEPVRVLRRGRSDTLPSRDESLEALKERAPAGLEAETSRLPLYETPDSGFRYDAPKRGSLGPEAGSLKVGDTINLGGPQTIVGIDRRSDGFLWLDFASGNGALFHHGSRMERAGRATFSLRSGDFSSRMTAAFSPFQRNPELRMAIAQVAKQRAQRLGAEWIEKSAVLRTVASIAKEQGIREALGYDERINAYLESLTPSARQELEFEPASLEDDPLVSAMLDHGKLMSRSTALKNGVKNLDEFDGVPWLPPAWYSSGSGITPGKMAKAMHEGPRGEGGPLSAGDSAQDLWEALGQIIASTKKNKGTHREAVQAYKEAQRAARADAKLEAEAWANQTRKAAGSPKAQRDMLKAALRTLDGILSAAPPEVRARVGGYVKLAGLATDEAMLQEIERRIEKLNVELEKWLKKEGVAEIQKLLKRGRPEAEAGKRGKGKDPDMHALFAAAERAIPMNAEAVAGELARLDTLIGGDTLTPEQEALAITERGIIELVGDLKSADSGRVFSALDSLREIYEGGWLKWKLAQIEKREERAGQRADFIADTGKSGIKPERDAADKAAVTLLGKIKGGFLSLSSFQEVLSYAFGSKSERVKALVDAEREASGQYEDVTQALADEVESLFADLAGGSVLAGERLRYDMAQRTIKTGKGELSQLEAIQALLMWRQEDGRRHMEGARDENGKPIGPWNYDQAWIDEITAALTPEARSVMAWLSQKYAAEHPALNALYRERYGVNMPAHDNYAPITVQPVQTKSGEVNDPVSGAAISSGSILVPGSLRARSRSAIAEPDFRDALQTFMAHTRQLEYWKAYYDLAFEANAILGNREVLNAVKAKGGEPAATALRKWIDAIAQGGFRDASATLGLHKLLSRMTGRAASVGLLGRFSTLLVQSTQLGAASVKMPVGAYLIRLSKLLTGNLSFRDAINSPFIQRRYKSAPPIVRQALEGLGVASRPNQITRATRHLGNLLSGADAMFTAGTYAMLLDYHRGTGRALGLSGAELETHAHTEAERDTEAVAQPTRMATRSLAELTSTNPLAKVSWAYASEARQKIALMAWATMNAKAEPAQFAKTAFLVFGIGGLMTQILKNLWREAKGDDDESKWAPERLTLSALAGPLHGVPLASELMGNQGMLSGVAWAWPALKDIASGEGDMRDVDTLLSTMGLFNDTAAGIASLSHAGLDAAKVLENLASEK